MRGILRIPIRTAPISLPKLALMTTTFTLKILFNDEKITVMRENFGFKRFSNQELSDRLQKTFSDYIISALTEISDDQQDHQKIYLEANYHLDKARKLLEYMPHPAGKMSYRLATMTDTLNKLIEGSDNFAAERAARFMEKNLVRHLRDIWQANTSTPFHSGGDGSGRNPRDFILECFNTAGDAYPEINWFKEVDYTIADLLIKSIKR